MPIPSSASELKDAIDSTFDKLRVEFESVDPEKINSRTMEGHAKNTWMSPHDLLAYLVGWAELVLLWRKQFKNGREVVFPVAGFKWNELGLLAQKFYSDYEAIPYHKLLRRLERRKDEILALIQDLDEEELYQTPFYKHYPFGRMIQLNTSSPYKNARIRLRGWKKLSTR